jgi:hypothetical protein
MKNSTTKPFNTANSNAMLAVRFLLIQIYFKMKIQEINKLKKKAIKEAQKEVDKIFNKYSKLIIDEIANQIPKGQKLISGNGMVFIQDENGKELAYGNSWSRTAVYSPKMEALSDLQYGTDNDDLQGNFTIPDVIEGRL